MLEYARLASAFSAMKYMGICTSEQFLRWLARHSNTSNVTPHGRQGMSTLPPFFKVIAAKGTQKPARAASKLVWIKRYAAKRIENASCNVS